ncbi:unnamed protein product, partial [Mesorhabditis spiculigera]
MGWGFAHPDNPDEAGRAQVQKELVLADIATEIYSVLHNKDVTRREIGAMCQELADRSVDGYHLLFR